MKIKLTLLALLISVVSFAQQGINYKALIKDDLGNVVAGQPIGVQFQIREATANGTAIYTETHTPTTDVNGIMVLNIGTGTTSDTFSAINWSSDDHWLNVQIDLAGGTNYTDMSTTQFMAVPYAKHAESAGNAASKIDDLSDGKSDTDGSSLFIGVDAGLNDDGTGNQNVGLGKNALRFNTTGFANTANGALALSGNTVGLYNSAYGSSALSSNTTGSGNIAIGSLALNANVLGDFNAAIGYLAGRYHKGSRNIFIGYKAGRSVINYSNDKLYIDNTQSDVPLIYGEFDTNLIRINGTLDVTGTLNIAYEVNREATGNANLIPIAYGTIDSAGNILSGTGNYTVNTANAPTFHINVTGSSLSHSNSSASVTPLSGAFRTASITHSNGSLRVYIFNSSGTQVANTFQFVIYEL